MKILITGTAGFIGYHTAKRLLNEGHEILGIDNLNDYYSRQLKKDRLNNLITHVDYIHKEINISDSNQLFKIFKEFKPEKVIHLAAQAGVLYSIENPIAYVESNLVGFTNILEACRYENTEHLIYSSTSSVYGLNSSMPFSTSQNTDHPLSFYAATKKSNEVMAHTYSHLFSLPTTGLRFFTVYGPWGRPDMALFKFTKAIIENSEINVYNHGKHKRDFTYVDDIVDGVFKVLSNAPKGNVNFDAKSPDPSSSSSPWNLYNIGSNNPIDLMDYISCIEKYLGKKAKIKMLPLQKGDVPETFADISPLKDDYEFTPKVSVDEGVNRFINWYKEYYKV